MHFAKYEKFLAIFFLWILFETYSLASLLLGCQWLFFFFYSFTGSWNCVHFLFQSIFCWCSEWVISIVLSLSSFTLSPILSVCCSAIPLLFFLIIVYFQFVIPICLSFISSIYFLRLFFFHSFCACNCLFKRFMMVILTYLSANSNISVILMVTCIDYLSFFFLILLWISQILNVVSDSWWKSGHLGYYVLNCGPYWNLFYFIWFPLTCPKRKKREAHLVIDGEVESQFPHLASSNNQEWSTLIAAEGWWGYDYLLGVHQSMFLDESGGYT